MLHLAAGDRNEPEPIDPAHLSDVLESLAQAKRREFATDAEVEAAFSPLRSMKLRFTRRAIDNIGAVADFLSARNPAAADRVQTDIYGSLQNLLLFPCRPTPKHGRSPQDRHEEVFIFDLLHVGRRAR
jgi:plasmid stabilization system protein ParE